jgi:hypothetical protein
MSGVARRREAVWRPRFVIGLALLLFLVQLLLAMHGVEHAWHHEDDGHVCAECLALAATTAVPPASDMVPPPPLAWSAPASTAVPPAPTFRRHAPFLSRAPPFAQS